MAVEDRAALRDLVVLYCRAVDRRDMALMRRVFHPDAFLDYGEAMFRGTLDNFIAASPKGMSAFAMTQHHVTNSYFETNGDRAEGETYLVAYHVLTGHEQKLYIAGARYLDRFERRDGEWRIAHRTALRDWENESGNVAQPNVGRLDGGDLSYERLAMFGKAGAPAS